MRAAQGLALVLALAACDGDAVPAVEFGEQIFADRRLSEDPENSYSCATCHDVTASPDPTRIYPGHTLYDSVSRASWWGGFVPEYLNAVNFCYVSFMGAPEPMQPDDPKAMALYEYLASISPGGPSPAIPLTFTKYIQSIPAGDPVRGEEVYTAACASCHGSFDSEPPMANVPRLPDGLGEAVEAFPNASPAQLLVEKVRHGKFWGVGGTSPPFSIQAITNEDLGALIGYFAR